VQHAACKSNVQTYFVGVGNQMISGRCAEWGFVIFYA
jgi:hypothetical protein